MKDAIVNKRAADAGLVVAKKPEPAATYNPRGGYQYPRHASKTTDYSRVAGLRDATINDPVGSLGARYDATSSGPEPHIMSKAAVATIVDKCMRAISEVLDQHKVVWIALGWLDVRQAMEKVIAQVIEKKAKAYPDGFKGESRPIKVVDEPVEQHDPALVEKLTEALGGLHAYVEDLYKNYPHDRDMPRLLAKSGPLLKSVDPESVEEEASPTEAPPSAALHPDVDIASLSRGKWFAAGHDGSAQTVFKVDDVEAGYIYATCISGNWPACFRSSDGWRADEVIDGTKASLAKLRITFTGPWPAGLHGVDEHHNYANEIISRRNSK